MDYSWSVEQCTEITIVNKDTLHSSTGCIWPYRPKSSKKNILPSLSLTSACKLHPKFWLKFQVNIESFTHPLMNITCIFAYLFTIKYESIQFVHEPLTSQNQDCRNILQHIHWWMVSAEAIMHSRSTYSTNFKSFHYQTTILFAKI